MQDYSDASTIQTLKELRNRSIASAYVRSHTMDALSCTSGMYGCAKTDIGVPQPRLWAYYDYGYRHIATAAMGVLRLRVL